MTPTTDTINAAIGFTPDWQLAGILVAGVILAIGFTRAALPWLLPNRLIPLVTWLGTSALYPLFAGSWSRETILAGLICGVFSTGAHSGLRATVDPEKTIEKGAEKTAKETRRVIRSTFGKSSQTNKKL